jgi:hypothetical protein
MKLSRLIMIGVLALAAYVFAVSYRDILRYIEMREM